MTVGEPAAGEKAHQADAQQGQRGWFRNSCLYDMTFQQYSSDWPHNTGELGSQQKARTSSDRGAEGEINVAAGRGKEIDRENIGGSTPAEAVCPRAEI